MIFQPAARAKSKKASTDFGPIVRGSVTYLLSCIDSRGGTPSRLKKVESTLLAPIRKTPGPNVRQSAMRSLLSALKQSRAISFFSVLSPVKSDGIAKPGLSACTIIVAGTVSAAARVLTPRSRVRSGRRGMVI